MVAQFRIDADVKEVERLTRHLRNAPRRIIPRALNATIRQVQTASARAIRKGLPLKIGTIRKNLRITKATRARYSGAITAVGFGVPIRDLGARQTRAGVTYRGTGGRELIKSGFIVQSLGRHVFKRTAEFRIMRRGRYQGQRREAIQKQVGPSVPQVFLQDHAQQEMAKTGAQRWPINVQQELNRVLKGFG